MKSKSIKSARSFLTTGFLSVLLAIPATAVLAEETTAIAILGSTPFAHQNYGINVVKGRAELVSSDGGVGQTHIVVRLSGLRPGTTHIGHIHGGTCASLTPGDIFHDLEAIVANESGEGTSKTKVPEGLQGFSDCGWWVAFHEGAANATPQTPAIAVGPVITRERVLD